MESHNFYTAFTGPQPSEVAARIDWLQRSLDDEPRRRSMLQFAVSECEERLLRLHRDVRESCRLEESWRNELKSIVGSI